MLNELQNLVPTEKELKLQVFINQLTNDLYNKEKVEVDSKKLLELLSYLTSEENISTQMKSAIEYQNKRISNVLNKIQVERFKDYIKHLEEKTISKQKVKYKIESYKELQNNHIKKYDEVNDTLQGIINVLEGLLEDK